MQVGSGTRVVVTGASRGIGREIARAFAAEGCALGLVARDRERLEQVASELPGEGHQALVADVSDPESIAAALERFGACDVLVANAGLAHYRPFLEQPLAEIEQMTQVNWLGCVYSVLAAVPAMVARGRGHVVVTASGAAYRAFPSAAVYGATKGAQRLFAEALWHELDGTGVGVTVVYPGEVESELHAHELERMPAWRKTGEEAPAPPLAEGIVAAVRDDRRTLAYPPIVRLLGIAHGISPRLGDAMLRRLRGRSAAPRRR